MQMSAAAIAPRQPHISAADRAHPLFPAYQQYRSSMSTQLVQAESFADWKASHEYQERMEGHQQHPRFPEFQAWMRETRGGARSCPGGNHFPNNFIYWLEGGRW